MAIMRLSPSTQQGDKISIVAIWKQRFFTRRLITLRGRNRGSMSMPVQIIMDHTGDTRHYFNADDTEALSEAEVRFKMLTAVGFTAAVRDAAGKATVTRSFDPTAEETLFFPRLVGG